MKATTRALTAPAMVLVASSLLAKPGWAAPAATADSSAPTTIELHLQRRDPNSGDLRPETINVDPRHVGVVVVDMWNWHWCKTSAARVAALVPRMKPVLAQAHDLGMTIFWCPSDVVDNYVGTPQHEAAANAPKVPLPDLEPLDCPAAPDGGGCTCGKERCQGNYGWNAMNPQLQMNDDDLMPNDLETLYSLCRQRGITHLIYVGVHTQVCLLGKSIGLRNLSRAGLYCILARDLTDAHGLYDPDHGITPDDFTARVVAHFEKFLAPTINFVDELKRLGGWDSLSVVDPVRVTPWGTPMRPHFFEQQLIVTLTAPWEANAQIHYTLDGSAPTPQASLYSQPLKLESTTHLRAAAYERGRAVCLESEGYFVRQPPPPPAPQVNLADLQPVRAVGPGHSPSSTDHRFSPQANPAQKDLSNRRKKMRMRGHDYDRGWGVQAPNQMIFDLKSEYDHFVALAGVDEGILSVNNGSNLAMIPSIVFKIYIDGHFMAASPVMRISEPPWRFDIPIPPGSHRISLDATDAGDGNREDLADWVDAGFTLRNP
jgi:hypothetical protein